MKRWHWGIKDKVNIAIISLHPIHLGWNIKDNLPNNYDGIGFMKVFEWHPSEANPHLFGVAPTMYAHTQRQKAASMTRTFWLCPMVNHLVIKPSATPCSSMTIVITPLAT
jgi:hypothetical protein